MDKKKQSTPFRIQSMLFLNVSDFQNLYKRRNIQVSVIECWKAPMFDKVPFKKLLISNMVFSLVQKFRTTTKC